MTIDYEAARQQRLADVCNRKHHYATKRRAREVAAKVRKRGGTAVFPYKCPVCHDWLLTSEPQKTSDVTRAQKGQRAPIRQHNQGGEPTP